MLDTPPTLGLPYILPSQAQKHVTHNVALDTLDALAQLRVESRSVSTPPNTPTLRQCNIVPVGSTNEWANRRARYCQCLDESGSDLSHWARAKRDISFCGWP